MVRSAGYPKERSRRSDKAMRTRTIRQTVSFKASPHDVYELLLDPRKHAAFTGSTAKISRRVGGSFSVFDGYAAGKNKVLSADDGSFSLGGPLIGPKGSFLKYRSHYQKLPPVVRSVSSIPVFLRTSSLRSNKAGSIFIGNR